MLIIREMVMEMLGHFPNCTMTVGVHVLHYRTREWNPRTVLILVCCECDAYRRLDECEETDSWFIARIEEVLDDTRVRLQRPISLQPACSGCGGQRHIGWCAA